MIPYTPNQALAVFIGLVLAGWFYNAIFVDTLAAYLPPSKRRTSLEVVIGVTITLVGAGILLGATTMLLLFALFAASGIPMIYGDFKRGERSLV